MRSEQHLGQAKTQSFNAMAGLLYETAAVCFQDHAASRFSQQLFQYLSMLDGETPEHRYAPPNCDMLSSSHL